MTRILVLVLAILHASSAGKLPSFVGKCDFKAADFAECTTREAHGALKFLTTPMREIGLPSLEPLEVPEMTIGAGTGPVALEQKYRQIQFHNFSKADVTKAVFDFEKKTLTLQGIYEEIYIVGQYDFNGQVLLLPIVGKGTSRLRLKKVVADCVLGFEQLEKNGKKFLKFNKVVLTTFEPELVSYNFENLFDGNKALGDNVNKVLNENWKEVFDDVKSGYAAVFGEIILGLCNSFFGKISATDTFDNF